MVVFSGSHIFLLLSFLQEGRTITQILNSTTLVFFAYCQVPSYSSAVEACSVNVEVVGLNSSICAFLTVFELSVDIGCVYFNSQQICKIIIPINVFLLSGIIA